jgi:hypothetical protein
MALFSEKELDNIIINLNQKDLHLDPIVSRIFGKPSKEDIPTIKYVALLYDQNSPLRLKIPDIIERKEECAELAELDNSKKASIFELSDEKIIGYINAYLRYQSSKVWAVLSVNESCLWEYQQELLSPITMYKNDREKLAALEVKTKLMSECDAIIRRIESYEEKLFGDNMSKKEEVLNYTPENIANL